MLSPTIAPLQIIGLVALLVLIVILAMLHLWRVSLTAGRGGSPAPHESCPEAHIASPQAGIASPADSTGNSTASPGISHSPPGDALSIVVGLALPDDPRPSQFVPMPHAAQQGAYPLVLHVGGRRVANPALFFRERTRVEKAARLQSHIAFLAYRGFAQEAGLNAATPEQFARTASALGLRRGKSNTRYFVDLALITNSPNTPASTSRTDDGNK